MVRDAPGLATPPRTERFVGGRRRALRSGAALSIALAGCLTLVLDGPGASRGATPRLALLLGDSLTAETAPVFVAPSGWRLQIDAHPGIAPCDWLSGPHPNFYDDIKQRPAAIVIETAGNDRTRCMEVNGALPHVGSPTFLARYEAALSTIVALSHDYGARVILLAPPPLLEPHLGAALASILAWAQQAAHVATSTSPRTAVSLHGAFTEALPCLPSESARRGCREGQIPVRTIDATYHLHFCPHAADFTRQFTCAAYSSGEVRWARATMWLLHTLS